MRFLCIDDDEQFAKETHKWLCEHVGLIEWTHVSSLALGLVSIKEAESTNNPYDVLIYDLLLPNETMGIMHIAALRNGYPSLFILGISAGESFNNDVVELSPRSFITTKTNAHMPLLSMMEGYRLQHGTTARSRLD